MKIDDFLEISILLSYYGNLLSNRQKTYMNEHFQEDYSLSEIAKSHNITRQAVYDNVKRGSNILREYETKIGFFKREKEIISSLKQLQKNLCKKRVDELISSFDI